MGLSLGTAKVMRREMVDRSYCLFQLISCLIILVVSKKGGTLGDCN